MGLKIAIPMFLRVKQIKGNCYYYAVESIRKNKKVEQRVFAYLGSYRKAKQQIKLQFAKDSDLLKKLCNRLEELHQATTTSRK